MPDDEPAAGPRGVPPDVALSASFLLLGVGRRVRDDVERGLREHGLSLRHLSALGHLSRTPGLSYSELARRAGVAPQSMQATLAQLEARGAVERRTEAGRGRTAELHVTDDGRALLARGQGVFSALDRALGGTLDDDDSTALVGLLLRLLTAPPGPGA